MKKFDLKITRILPFLLATFVFTNLAMSQDLWQETSLEVLKRTHTEVPLIQAENAAYFSINFQAVYDAVLTGGAGLVIELPNKNGALHAFKLVENTTMSAGLKTSYPEILTFNIVSVENQSAWGKIDISPKGLYAMYQVPGSKTVFIDPVFNGSTEAYILYTRADYIATKTAECLVSGGEADFSEAGLSAATPYNDCEIKTYRLAVAATGEYTQFHGGTVSLALAAIVTTVNRVNMVYEREFSVTLELIDNTDDLIYTNPSSDPYTNGSPGNMIVENQTNTNTVIGSFNYDIGHVFGTNSGGLAGLGVVCSSSKARGVTGSGAPIGDSFDIDYVAHEMGHQFGGAHTFNNSCQGNRNNATAMEPGSGSTIMAYAGICSPNVQNNSDDYFHGVSMRQIGIEIESHNCPVVTAIPNVSPQLSFATTEVFLPISTPFALNAQASDADEDDVLTYCWEQMDNEISTQPPNANSTTGPNFRSFDPSLSPTRYFPRLEALANSPSQTWERLPAAGRNMNFRVSVRDNSPGAGCTDFANSSVTFVATAGPFAVTVPNLSEVVWDAFDTEIVTWDVANTDVAPVNCQLVDIYLSIDGGSTYPITLIENVPNTGSAEISVPNTMTSQARVMVMNENGTFFDISNNNFSITGISDGFYLDSDEPNQIACIGDDLVFTVNAYSVGNFNDPITLSLNEEPAEVTATFGTTTLLPGESTTLTISNTSGLVSSVIDLLVVGSSNGTDSELPLQAGFNAVDAVNPELLMPENNTEFSTTDVVFSWTPSASPDAVYQLQLATNSDFSALENDITNIADSTYTILGLDPETTYFWRVKKSTACGDSEFSDVYSFKTHTCFEYISLDVPENIPSNVGVIASNIEVLSSGILTDVNVFNVTGTHNRVSDLVFQLQSPQGSNITLVSNVCGTDSDFDFSFDDAGIETIDCPPTTGNTYQPEDLLSNLNGEDSEGIWKLRVFDQETGAGGSLNTWSLQLCFANGSSFLLSTNQTNIDVCQNDEVSFGVTAVPVFEYTEPITLSASNLPSGVSVSFNPQEVMPGESSAVIVTADATTAVGTFILNLNGVSSDLTYDLEIETNINEENPEAISLLLPDNLSDVSSAITTFEWEASLSPAAVYGLDIAYDAAFTEMIDSYDGLNETTFTYAGLPPVETLYWRVRTNNSCAEASSAVYLFNTSKCYYDSPTDLPINISAASNTYSSDINIPFTGNVESVSVGALSGIHARVSDLSARLISPSGTVVELFANICGSDQNFDLAFADGGIAEIDCPPTTGFQYAPTEPLSAFTGEDANGTWTLELQDSQSGGGGSFQNWALEICFEENVFGLADANQYKLSIYPNPAKDLVKIGFESGSGVELIRLYDVSGRQLTSIQVANREWIEIDLSEFASGVYFIRATGTEGSSSFKLIKEN